MFLSACKSKSRHNSFIGYAKRKDVCLITCNNQPNNPGKTRCSTLRINCHLKQNEAYDVEPHVTEDVCTTELYINIYRGQWSAPCG